MFKKVALTVGAAVTAAAVLAGGWALLNQPSPPGFDPGTQYVVDSVGTLSYDQAVAYKNDGVVMYIQALTWLPPEGLGRPCGIYQSLKNAQDAGLLTAGYALVTDTASPEYSVSLAHEMPKIDPVKGCFQTAPDQASWDAVWDKLVFVAVDVEQPVSYSTVNLAVDGFDQLGKGRVIYTNYGSWTSRSIWTDIRPEQPLPAFPANTWLWNASWDNNPGISYARLPFGGVTIDRVIGEQWSGNYSAHGLGVDRDAFYVAALLTFQPEPTPSVTPVPSNDLFGPCTPWGGRDSTTLQLSADGGTWIYPWSLGKWIQVPTC